MEKWTHWAHEHTSTLLMLEGSYCPYVQGVVFTVCVRISVEEWVEPGFVGIIFWTGPVIGSY